MRLNKFKAGDICRYIGESKTHYGEICIFRDYQFTRYDGKMYRVKFIKQQLNLNHGISSLVLVPLNGLKKLTKSEKLLLKLLN